MHIDDLSDDEVEAPNRNPKPKEDQDEEILLRVLSRAHSKLVVEVVPYDRNWIPILCWIGSLIWRISLSMKIILIIGR